MFFGLIGTLQNSRAYLKHNASLAWPLALNALLMQSMLVIDTFLVSPLGDVPLAAMGIATTVVGFVLGVQMALANGTQLVLSRAFGTGNRSTLRRGVWSGMTVNVLIGALFFVTLLLSKGWIIERLASRADLAEQVHAYLDVSVMLVVVNSITQVCIALCNALGKTRIPFKGYILELPINVVVSYFCIYGIAGFEGIGLKGAALGSLVAILVRLIYLLTRIYKLFPDLLEMDVVNRGLLTNARHHFLEIFPVAANVTMLQAGSTVYLLILSQLPVNQYAAVALVTPWIRAGSQFITAWAHASAISVSMAIGSRKFDTLREHVDASIDTAVLISCASALLFVGLSIVLPHFYPALDTTTHLALASIAPLYIFLQIPRGYNTVHGHVLRALGKTTSVFKVNFTGQWLIGIPVCAAMVLGLNAGVAVAYGVFVFEELVKMWPFRRLARKTLDAGGKSIAESLNY